MRKLSTYLVSWGGATYETWFGDGAVDQVEPRGQRRQSYALEEEHGGMTGARRCMWQSASR